MSSEALERAERIRENISHVARGCRSASSHNPAPYLNSIEAALVALLAELARLEQELRDARQGWDGWQAQCLAAEAALAVAREREQRLRERQDNAVWAVEIAWEWLAYFALESDEEPDAPLSDVAEALRAARAALAEPEQAEAQGEVAASRSGQGSPDGNAQGSGSASAAADEPPAEVAALLRDDRPPDSVFEEFRNLHEVAAADEPGETP